MPGATGAIPSPALVETVPTGSVESTSLYRRIAPTAWLSPHSQVSVGDVSSDPSAMRYQRASVASFS